MNPTISGFDLALDRRCNERWKTEKMYQREMLTG
jgi:hypothetical protein